MPTTVDFCFDPGCPFTWRTSSWLVDVARRRGIEVQWHLMSLASSTRTRRSHRSCRPGWTVPIARSGARSGSPRAWQRRLAAAYTAIGTRLHDSNQEADERTIAAALADEGLSHKLIERSPIGDIAAALAESHARAQAVAGQESGSPITAIDGRPGYFGPIVVPIPTGDEADKLFDALIRSPRFRRSAS